MNSASRQPQVLASDPDASVFVTANAGSGKTSTLVKRVARLLLRGAEPQAILCVTYTKAAAAEMQRRLFEELGAWAVTPDNDLAATLADLDESPTDLSKARRLFARALETPGGLKIQTLHAFCEKLLRRFPLEAGVSPGFQVLEDAAAARVSARARAVIADMARRQPWGPIGRAYRHFAVELDWRSFEAMFAAFEARRSAIGRLIAEAAGAMDALALRIWTDCGLSSVVEPDAVEAEALAGADWNAWRRAGEQLSASAAVTDQALGAALSAAGPQSTFAVLWAAFSTQTGQPRSRLGTASTPAAVRDWLKLEQARLSVALERLKAARIARDTYYAVTLAEAYGQLYDAAKAQDGALDFGDLIARAAALLTQRADAAWVLYKLDGGIDHILLDEAQDTAPDQWAILRALTEEFFAEAGVGGPRGRTLFAVGDEKQSIYSFQGAAPEQLAAEQFGYRARVENGGGQFREVPLETSFRSTPQILAFVDAVFADPALAAGLRPGEQVAALRHLAKRQGDRGTVDLWPLEESDAAPEVDPWEPVDQEPAQSANKKLARRIAGWIKAVLDRGEAVYDRRAIGGRRPARPGDFLILVRRRKVLFHEIIRALKREGVAVGGADRLKLSEHVVFQDLMALGRFAQFAEDDLTLAALLRSPLCDMDEQSLYDLAQGRRTSLWSTLTRRAQERPAWAEAKAFFDWALTESAQRQPFDFYGRVLSRLDAEGRSMRARMLTRLGREAEDAIEAFMGQALVLERGRVRDLERFLDAMAASELEIKREQEDTSAQTAGAQAIGGRAGGEVRVMTTHGAKGLEAPIVILPDTTTCARAMGGPLLDLENGGLVWAPRRGDDCPASAQARARREAAAAGESLRLFYVALTRARDRLVICGVKTAEHFYRASWCDLAAQAFERPEIAAGARLIADGDAQIVRFGADPTPWKAEVAANAKTPPTPAWIRRLATPSPEAMRYAAPSELADAERGPSASPLAERGGLGRYRRGRLIHRLLQLLPDLPPTERAAAALSLLRREPDLIPDQAEEMASAALAVLEDPRFAAVFGAGSRAEVAIAGSAPGLPPDLAISGRIDRLLVTSQRVMVVDFKTNRPAPDRIEDADPAYLTQMALYAAVLSAVFPGRSIEAALIWTDGPKLTPVPEKIMAEALAKLRGLG